MALPLPEAAESDWYPDAQTFFLWHRIGREAARKVGRPDPRLPDWEAVSRWFASEEAVEAVDGRRGCARSAAADRN